MIFDSQPGLVAGWGVGRDAAPSITYLRLAAAAVVISVLLAVFAFASCLCYILRFASLISNVDFCLFASESCRLANIMPKYVNSGKNDGGVLLYAAACCC